MSQSPRLHVNPQMCLQFVLVCEKPFTNPTELMGERLMIHEDPFGDEPFAADRTHERPLPGVHPQVSSQTTLVQKSLGAVRTAVGLLPDVAVVRGPSLAEHEMLREVTLVFEPGAAHLAPVRPFVGVSQPVPAQRRLVYEALSAFQAAERFLQLRERGRSRVHGALVDVSPDVLVEAVLVFESVGTNGAVERFLLHVHLHVLIKTALQPEHVPTFRTREWLYGLQDVLLVLLGADDVMHHF